MTISVKEVRTIAKDMLEVRIETPELIKGGLVEYTTPYLTNSLTITNCQDNGNGEIRVTVTGGTLPTSVASYENWVIGGVVGTTEANGFWHVRMIDTTHFDIIFSKFTNAYVSGGYVIVNVISWRGGAASDVNPFNGKPYSAFWPVGPEMKHKRWEDTQNTEFLDETVLQNVSLYTNISGINITKVSLKAVPNGMGQHRSASGGGPASTMSKKYLLILKLASNLPQGTHTINFPAALNLPPYTFTFDDKKTVCTSIHATYLGHRPKDEDKYGYLSYFAPGMGASGGIEFVSTYGVTQFHVLNSINKIVFTGNVVQRCTPTSLETGMSNPQTLINSGITGLNIIGLTTGATTTITYEAGDHDVAEGQYIYLAGVRGINLELFLYAFQVNTTTKTFVVGTYSKAGAQVNYATTGTWTGGGKIMSTWTPNAAATYVYGLDYSNFNPTHDDYYKLYIPGIGVSENIRIAEDVWWEGLRKWGGMLWGQASGIAQDGRFGYTTPVSMKPGVDKTVHISYLPQIFASEGAGASFTISIPSAYGSDETWRNVAAGTITNAWGGYKDAGDWDGFIGNGHMYSAYSYLDFYDNLPDPYRDQSFGVPRSSATRDATLFAGTDGLGDLVHLAIWEIDFYRQLQLPDGSIYGGLQFAHNVSNEPSWLAKCDFYVYAPDPYSNYIYSIAAAKLSLVLRSKGFTALADVFKDSALAAYNWSENLRNNTAASDAYFNNFRIKAQLYSGIHAVTNVYGTTDTVPHVRIECASANFTPTTVGGSFVISGITGTTEANDTAATVKYVDATHIDILDNYGNYVPFVNAYISGGTVKGSWQNLADTLWTNCIQPRAAAGVLMARITNNMSYTDALFDPVNGYTHPNWYGTYWNGICYTEYKKLPAANPSYVSIFDNKVVTRAYEWCKVPESTDASYRVLKFPGLAWSFGAQMTNHSLACVYLMWAHKITNDVRYLKPMMSGLSTITGANQQNESYTVGIGKFYPKAPLHNDVNAMGWDYTVGHAIYGPSKHNEMYYSLNFGGSPYYGITAQVDPNFTPDPDYMKSRQLVPIRWTWPAFESMWHSSGLISVQEFTQEECLVPYICESMYLHCQKNNTEKQYHKGSNRFLMKAAFLATPTLTWATGTTIATPVINTSTTGLLTGDLIDVECSHSSTFSTNFYKNTITVTSTHLLSANLNINTVSLLSGVYYFKIKIRRSESQLSAWSSSVTVTIADNVAPTLSSFVASKIDYKYGQGSVVVNEDNGTLYWVLSETNSTPTFDQISAGNDSTGFPAKRSGSRAITSTGTQNFSGTDFTNLTGNTFYYAYACQIDINGNKSTVYAATGFKTDITPNTRITETGVGRKTESGVIRIREG